MKTKGIPGIVEERWLSLPLQMKISGLEDFSLSGSENKVLHVHIPEGEPLLDEECGKSLRSRPLFGPEYTMYD